VEYRKDFRKFAIEQLRVGDQPLKFWPCQIPLLESIEKQMEDRGFARCIWLKSRQVGASTLAEAIVAWRTMLWPHVNALVLADQAERARTLFEISRTFYDHLSDDIRPTGRYITKRELVFANPSQATRKHDPGLQSRIVVESAHKKNIAIGCLHPDVLIWTSRGIVLLRDVHVGDEVVTHSGRCASVKMVVARQVDSRKWVQVRFWQSEFPLICTEDHGVWTSSGWVEASQLKKNEWVELPVRALPEIRMELLDFSEFRHVGRGPSPRGLDVMELTFELGWVFGLYLAEGSLTGQANKSSWRSGIRFSLSLDEQGWATRIEQQFSGWAKKAVARIREEDHSCVVTIHNTWLARAFHTWFYGNNRVCRAWTKHVPEWVQRAPDGFIDGFLGGYFAGDGSQQNGRVTVCTASSVLAGQIRDLIMSRHLGLASLGFVDGEVRQFPDRECQTRGAWTLGVSGDGASQIAKWAGWEVTKTPDMSRMWRWQGEKLLVKVRKVLPVKAPDVMYDLEIDHVDHSYRVSCAVVANSNWQIVHGSECARYPDPAFVLDGVIPAVHRVPGTIIILESSAEMAGTWYRDLCEASARGDTAFAFTFVPWYLQPEYCIPLFKGERLDLSADERHIIAEYGLTPGHIKWMREKLSELGNDWDLFRQSFPLTVEDSWVTPGAQVFPMKCLRELRHEIRPPKRMAEVHAGPRILDAPQGRLLVWDEPEQGKAYDIGVDVAMGQGRDDSSDGDLDSSVACVLERGSNRQVAEWSSRAVDPFELANVLFWLGKYYNTAQLAVETNGIGGGTNQQLSKMGYSNVYCLSPEHRVLTAELRWIPIGNLKAGDKLIGFDEKLPGSHKRRRYRLAEVVGAVPRKDVVHRIVLSDGTVFHATKEHLWLVLKSRSASQQFWKATQDLKVGDRLPKVFVPWVDATTFDAGWLSGLVDGEGSAGYYLGSRPGYGEQRHLSIGQNEGVVLDKVCMLLRKFGIPFSIGPDSHGSVCYRVRVSRKEEFTRLLGMIRPVRLLSKVEPEWLGVVRAFSHAFVESVEVVGERDVVMFGTTTSTYIAEGFPTHNCWRYRDELTPRYSRKTGWETNSRSKPWLVGFAAHEMINGRVHIASESLLKELEMFVQKGPNEWGAVAGHHDDKVISWMIALLTSDDECFEKYYGLQKTMSDGANPVSSEKRVLEPWEYDGTFRKVFSEREDMPWE